MTEFAKREEAILRTFRKERTFQASVERRRGRPRFVFYEGPPTANGRPGIHHVLVRAMKDAFLRYRTMLGFLVERRAGWDTHGLPVEIEVEKELGLRSKAEIERYGIARFNERAKQSVWRYKDEWEKLTERIGFWIDQEHPYVTYEHGYIESLWGVLKTIADARLLVEDFKVVPYCFRCGTALSSHEVALGYQSVTENSVFVKFPLRGERDTFVLVWTTTPWTLPGNVALAVGEDIDYVKVLSRQHGETYILARAVADRLLPDAAVIGEMKGRALVGLAYEPLFDIPELRNDRSHRIEAADFVNTDEGTGVVHIAVMYGEDDYRLGVAIGLPKVHTVGEDGAFLPIVPCGLAGRNVKDAETERMILALLSERKLLFREEPYTHDYPFCWRCSTPLLYYAKTSWFIQMSALRDRLIAENAKITWVPAHLRDGRFGEWLREVKDWAISRERYWGTPLPIWRCSRDARHVEVIGSLAELRRRAKLKNRYLILRHGFATHNEDGTISCYPERRPVRLTPKGRAQIARAARELKRRRIDLIFSSDLRRTAETAAIVGAALGITPRFDRRLREYNVGVFNGRKIAEYRAFIGTPGGEWTKRAKGGETWRDVRRRMVRFVREMEERYEGKTILIVSHGDPLFLLKGAMLGLEEDAYTDGTLGYPKVGIPEVLSRAMLPLDDDGRLDLHRPWIDCIEFPCTQCAASSRGRREGGGTMRRVPAIFDVWFDSGAMPFAARHPASSLRRPKPYPADFICEAIDQTRGWFYTLLAVAVASGHGTPYRTVLSTGHVLDREGKKMSKSKGNVVNPWEMVERYGADAVRWYFFTVNQPWDAKRFDERDIRLVQNRFIGTLWNVYQFFRTYAARTTSGRGGRRRGQARRAPAEVPPHVAALDRWIASRLEGTVAIVRERMDAYDITAATRAIEEFVVNDLSNWYVRRSRDRFQKPASREDYLAASALLGELLSRTAALVAPFIPFLAEEIFRAVTGRGSVHLEDFPAPLGDRRDPDLEGAMAEVRDVVAAGLAARRSCGIPVRQPLPAIAVASATALRSEFAALLADELNVRAVKPLSEAAASWQRAGSGNAIVALDTTITPELRAEGWVREFIRAVQELRKEVHCTPKDRILLRWEATIGRSDERDDRGITEGSALAEVIARRERDIASTVRAAQMECGPKRQRESFDAERELRFGEAILWFGIRRLPRVTAVRVSRDRASRRQPHR